MVLAISLAAAIALALLLGLGWMLDKQRMSWVTQRGKQLLSEARGGRDVDNALDRWEEETGVYWHARVSDWIAAVFKDKQQIDDAHVRMLLARAAGVDYGDRVDDWKRWYDARKRMQNGQDPVVPQRERVTLESTWRAPIGLTAWYTSILPLDGKVYVSTLGTTFDDTEDTSDGVVRIDGATGAADMFFEPPDKGPRDVIGLAAARDLLFAASRNGYLYGIDKSGAVSWKSSLGAAAASLPMVFNANKDDSPDVCVVTAKAQVVAVSGASGKTLWITPLDSAARGDAFGGGGAAESRALIATMALGDVPGFAGPTILVATSGGPVIALNTANGRPLWRQTLDAGVVASPVCLAGDPPGGPTIYLGDTRGKVLSIAHVQKETSASAAWWLGDTPASGMIGGVRTMMPRGSDGPLVVAASVGPASGSINVLNATGLRWRYSVSGQVRATPAIGDINGDGSPELLIGSTLTERAGNVGGWLTVMSAEGHVLRREAFAAGVEAGPVIADVDGDGFLEVLVADRSGLLHCFATKRFGPVEWGVAGGDIRNTNNAANAYAFSQTPSGYQWSWKPGARGR